MDKYLVVENPKTGFAELANVGIFLAVNTQYAILEAAHQWNRSAYTLQAFKISELIDGWSYYV